jgi:co-chaperonin GroES (HSP10)
MQLKPMNRHLLIRRVSATQEGGDSAHGILLPEEYKPKQDRHCFLALAFMSGTLCYLGYRFKVDENSD